MKASTTIAVCLVGASTASASASPQSNPVPSDVSIPMYAAPTGMTVIPITFTADFGTVPAGYVTYLTQPIQPSGPVYSTGTGSAPISKATTGIISSKASVAKPIPTTMHHSPSSSSSSSIGTTSSTPAAATSAAPASQTTHTGAASAMAVAAGLPAGVAAVVGLALF